MQNYFIGGVGMSLPIMVGAGACKTPVSTLPYMRHDVSVGAVSTGSYTPQMRPGNEGVLFWPKDASEFMQEDVGLNSFGMPNMGNERAAAELKRFRLVHPLIASIAGFSVDDYVAGVRAFDGVPCVSAIKANLGCPNVHGKPVPIAYDPDSLLEILEAMLRLQPTKPIWLKLSPYITAKERDNLQSTYPFIDFSNVPVVNPGFLGDILSIIWEYQHFVRAVVFSNTLPNVTILDESGNPVTTPNGGKAGLSGKILRPISINLIRQAATMLPGHVDLIGSGGVTHGDHVVEYFAAGAQAVFCTSGPFWAGNNPRFFADMLSGSERLQEYLSQHSQPKED